jgi:hypothetical protein
MFETGKLPFRLRRRLRAIAAQKVNLLARDRKIAGVAFHKSVAPQKFQLRLSGPDAIERFDIALP